MTTYTTNRTRSQSFSAPQKSLGMLFQAKEVNQVADLEKVEDFKSQLIEYNDEVNQALVHSRSVIIDSAEAVEENLDLAGKMRKLSKRLEERRKEITAPAREFVSRVNSMVKGYTDKLEESVAQISQKIGQYNEAQLAAQEVDLELDALLAEATGIAPTMDVIPVHSRARSAEASTYERTVIEVELEDLGKVPCEYLQLNDQLVKAAVKAGVQEIPGVKITIKKITTVKAN